MLRKRGSNGLRYVEFWIVNKMYVFAVIISSITWPDEENARGRRKVQGEDRGWTAGGKASKHASVLGLRGL